MGFPGDPSVPGASDFGLAGGTSIGRTSLVIMVPGIVRRTDPFPLRAPEELHIAAESQSLRVHCQVAYG